MKRAGVGWVMVASVLLALGIAQLSAQPKTVYNVLTLPTLGGVAGQANSINNRGWASRLADFAGDGTGSVARRPTVPLHGQSKPTAADAINDLGQVVGISGPCEVAGGDMSAAHA